MSPASGKFKNGQVPVLLVDDTQIAQSNAILVYAGKIAHLYPWDALEALKVEEFLANIDDISSLFLMFFTLIVRRIVPSVVC